MKRFTLLILLCLLGGMVAAQPKYHARYWFDRLDSESVVDSSATGTFHTLLGTQTLAAGMHNLHVMVRDTSGRWSPPQTHLFYRVADTLPTNPLRYTCWYDMDFDARQTGDLSSGGFLLNAVGLSHGMHNLHIMVQDINGRYFAPQNAIFYRVADTLPTHPMRYTCWFDNDFDQHQSGDVVSGNVLLNTTSLSTGMHNVHILVQDIDGRHFAPQDAVFYRVPDTVANPTTTYAFWFDEDIENRQSGNIDGNTVLLDVESLEPGMHILNMLFDLNGVVTMNRTIFYKPPQPIANDAPLPYTCWFDDDFTHRVSGQILGGTVMLNADALEPGIHQVHLNVGTALHSYLFLKPAPMAPIVRYEYWYNDDPDSLHSVVAVNNLDTLNLTQLMTVPSIPVRSTYFHFDPNPDGVRPFVNSKNDIYFRTLDANLLYADLKKTFVDITVVDSVYADTLEGLMTRTIASPYNDTIHWFQFQAGVGDSISFKASKRCTMQLFAPSGEKVWELSGRDVVYWQGLHTMENGTYYLAVHDAEDTNGTLDVSFEWIYKYAVLQWNVHRVGNGGISSVTFIGNGYASLDTVFLIHGTDTLPPIYINRETNTKMVVAFNFEGADTGVYRGVFRYVDEDLFKGNMLTVEEPREILLERNMSYSGSFLRGSASVYRYQITNTGNMTAYAIPLHIRVESQNETDVRSINLYGLELPLLDNYLDFSESTDEERQEWHEWAMNMDDKHRFLRGWIHDTIEGDSTYVYANYFYLTLAPYETKTIIASVTSVGDIAVWMSLPDSITPQTMTELTRAYYRYDSDGIDISKDLPSDPSVQKPDKKCCALKAVTCIFGIGSDITAIEAFVAQLAAVGLIETGIGAATAEAIALNQALVSCISGAIAQITEVIRRTLCSNDEIDIGNIIESYLNLPDAASLASTIFGCVTTAMGIKALETGQKVASQVAQNIMDMISGGLSGLSLVNVFTSSCVYEVLQDDCDEDKPDPDGGPSNAYVPSDPNDIIGYIAESGSRYVGEEVIELPYIIEFENDTNIATAPAHTVVVADTLDSKLIDLSSFSATGFSIGDNYYSVNGGKEFLQTVDLRPNLNVLAEVRLQYNEQNGIATWVFRSLDPLTLLDITDPTIGFLPINFHGDGVGEVHFTINRKDNLRNRDTISNSALIFFDNEDPIATPVWHNIVDVTPPTSVIDTVIYTAGMAKLGIHATDTLSGAWRYNVYGKLGEAWMPLAINVSVDSVAIFTADSGQYETILTAAIDSAGNVEPLIITVPCVTAYDTVRVSACESYTWFDSIYNVSGDYVRTRPSSNPAICDSVITLRLNIFYTVPLDIAAGQWHAISTPMHNTANGDETADGVTNLVGDGFAYDLYYYNEGEGTWYNYQAQAFDIAAGVGYIYRRSASTTLQFNGLPNIGGSTGIAVPLSAECTDNDIRGFNLIGNPYPHAVNYAAPYYELRHNGTWYARPGGVIGVAQGFLVHTASATSYTFADANPGKDDGTESPAIALTVSGNGYEDVVYAMFGEGEGLPKMAHLNANAPSMSIPLKTDLGERRYSIGVLDEGTEQFPLTLAASAGEYTIKAQASQLPYLHLIDNVTGTDCDLLNHPTYTFKQSSNQTMPDRFLVRLAPTQQGGREESFAYNDGNTIVVTGNGRLQIFDMLGRKVYESDVESELRIPTSGFHAGMYALRLGEKSQKIVVR